MSYPRFVVVVGFVVTSVGLAQAQGRSGRDRDVPRPTAVPPKIEQRVEARADQAVQQQLQRRAGEEARRSVERRASAAEMAAQAAARRSARESSTHAETQRFANSRGIRSEVIAEKAIEHADVHALIAVGRLTGKPPQFSDEQRAKLKDVFGDAALLEPRSGDHASRSNRQNGRESKSRDSETDLAHAAPGARANANARLANAIRVRRAQISELRDQAIEGGDETLLERADRLEKTLDIFLENQARVEANLAEVGLRVPCAGSGGIVGEPTVSDSTIRTAELDAEDGLIRSE